MKRSLLEKTKLCECCGDAYAKPQNQPWGRWDKRRFCSLECWWQSRPNWNRYAKESAT
jgi:hypothetical protein